MENVTKKNSRTTTKWLIVSLMYWLIDVISWCDVSKYGVVAILKCTIGGNAWTVNHFQFNRQMAWCLVHWRRCYGHRVLYATVNITNMQRHPQQWTLTVLCHWHSGSVRCSRMIRLLLVLSVHEGLEDIARERSEKSPFSTTTLSFDASAPATLASIRIVITLLEKRVYGLHFCRLQYGSIFIQTLPVGNEIHVCNVSK